MPLSGILLGSRNDPSVSRPVKNLNMDHGVTLSHNQQPLAHSTCNQLLSNDAALIQRAFAVLQSPSSSPADCTNANRFLEQFQSSASTNSSLRACFELLEKDTVPADTKVFAATQLKRSIQVMPATRNNDDFSVQMDHLKNGVFGVVRQLPHYASLTNGSNNEQQRSKQLSSLRRQLCICLADLCLLSDRHCLTYLDELVQSYTSIQPQNNFSSLVLIDCFTMLLEELDNDKLEVPKESRNSLLSITSRVLDILDSLASSISVPSGNYDAETEKLLISLLKCFEKWVNDAGNAGVLYKDRVAGSAVYRIALLCMQNPGALGVQNQNSSRGTSLVVLTAAVDLLSTISSLFMDTHGVQSELLIAKQHQVAVLHIQPVFDQLVNYFQFHGRSLSDSRDISEYISCYVRLFIDAATGVVDELVDNYSADGATLGNAQILPIVLKCMQHVPSYRHWIEFLYQLSEQLAESMQADVIAEPQMIIWCEWYVRFIDVLVDDVSIDAEALNGDVLNGLLHAPSSDDSKNDDDDDQGIEDDREATSDSTSIKRKRAKTAGGVLVEDITDLRYEIPDIMKSFVDAMPTHTLVERILLHKMHMNSWFSVEACLFVAGPLMPHIRRKYVTPVYAQIIDACIALHNSSDEESSSSAQPMQLRLTAVRFLGKCAKLFTWRDSSHSDAAAEASQIFSDERFARLITSLLSALRRSPAQLGYAVCYSLLKYSEACPVEFARYRHECVQFLLPNPSFGSSMRSEFVLPLRAVSLLTEAVIRAANTLPNIVERFEFVEYLTSSVAQSLTATYGYQQHQREFSDGEKRHVRHALDVIAVGIKEWSWKITSSSSNVAGGRINFDHSLSAPPDHSTERVHAGDVHSAAQLLLLGTGGGSAAGVDAHAHTLQGGHRRMQTPPSTPVPPAALGGVDASHESPQQQLARLKRERYAPLIERLMQTVANTCIQFIERESIVEKCVRCMRHMLRSLGQEAAPLVPELMRLIVQLYAAKKYSCFLYLASIVIDEFGMYESCQQALLQLTHQLCTMTSIDSFGLHAVFGPSSNVVVMPSAFDVARSDAAVRAAFSERVDIIEDYFCLCQRWIQRCGHVFVGPSFNAAGGDAEHQQNSTNESVADHLLQQMMLSAMLSLLYQTQEHSLGRVCDFFVAIGTLFERQTSRNSPLAAKFDQHGFPPQLLATILVACVNNQLQSNLVEDLAGLLYTLRSVYDDDDRFCRVFLRGYAVEQVRTQCGSLPGDDDTAASGDAGSLRASRNEDDGNSNELRSLEGFCNEIDRGKDHARQMYNAIKNLMRAYKAIRRRTAAK